MAGYAPIDCGDYDVLELACTEGAEVALALDGEGETVVGTATTLRTDGTAEYLVLRAADGTSRDVRLDRIRRLEPLSRPTRVRTHAFARASRGADDD